MNYTTYTEEDIIKITNNSRKKVELSQILEKEKIDLIDKVKLNNEEFFIYKQTLMFKNDRTYINVYGIRKSDYVSDFYIQEYGV